MRIEGREISREKLVGSKEDIVESNIKNIGVINYE